VYHIGKNLPFAGFASTGEIFCHFLKHFPLKDLHMQIPSIR